MIIPKLVCSENGSDECHSEVIGNDFGEGYQTDSKWRDYDCGRMETIASSNAKLSQEQGRLSQLDRFPNSLQKKSFQNIELGK